MRPPRGVAFGRFASDMDERADASSARTSVAPSSLPGSVERYMTDANSGGDNSSTQSKEVLI